jgi:hypothetical protein
MDLNKLLNEIIPPADYEHRNGFSNKHLVDRLNGDERRQVEDALIEMARHKPGKYIDTLIVETLSYLNSQKALPVLIELQKNCSDDTIRLTLLASIYQLNQDNEMVGFAIESFNRLSNVDNKNPYYQYSLSRAFYALIKFRSPKTRKLIEQYVSHENILISANAKTVLGLPEDNSAF